MKYHYKQMLQRKFSSRTIFGIGTDTTLKFLNYRKIFGRWKLFNYNLIFLPFHVCLVYVSH